MPSVPRRESAGPASPLKSSRHPDAIACWLILNAAVQLAAALALSVDDFERGDDIHGERL